MHALAIAATQTIQRVIDRLSAVQSNATPYEYAI
jgi:hypothetical protein